MAGFVIHPNLIKSMTSANVTNYIIRDSQGNTVGEHSQHCYCKTNWQVLLKFIPFENFTIQSWGLDEEEARWEGKKYNLRDFVGYLRVNRYKI
jgi:hypothetical protein